MDSDWRRPVKISGLAPGRIKCRTDAIAAHDLGQHLIQRTDARYGVEQHRPDAAGDDDQRLHFGAETGEQDQYRHQHRRGNRAQKFQYRLEHIAQIARGADRNPDRDAQNGGRDIADREAHQTRHDVLHRVRGEPQLAEGLHDGTQRRKVEILTVRARKPPRCDQRHRQRKCHRNAP